MKRPCLEDIETACMWLEANEGEDGESEACSRVATWLASFARSAELRSAAREAGCSVKYLRKIIKENSQ
jgi:hypothetical protein